MTGPILETGLQHCSPRENFENTDCTSSHFAPPTLPFSPIPFFTGFLFLFRTLLKIPSLFLLCPRHPVRSPHLPYVKMGFIDVLTDSGLTLLTGWLATRSYIIGHSPSQADVAVFKAIKSAPDSSKYPHAARWYKHIASFEDEFATLAGDASKPYTSYGPGEAEATTGAPVKTPAAEEAADEDDVDLFGSDDEEEDAEAVRVREERLAAYREKKAAKPKTTAKSVVTLDVKPWDDETDMAALEAAVRSIEKDGLVWGASKLVPVGFGIKKLQINLVVEDEKISLGDLEEEIQGFEDHVQSTDIAAMQKL
ncbi:hypothetical protein F4777DRAFT_544028 [Nemania sp. FL0916]|nr:hypothetical protein F4777DRAFT_544028 [Nemania sp. FL0916]